MRMIYTKISMLDVSEFVLGEHLKKIVISMSNRNATLPIKVISSNHYNKTSPVSLHLDFIKFNTMVAPCRTIFGRTPCDLQAFGHVKWCFRPKQVSLYRESQYIGN